MSKARWYSATFSPEGKRLMKEHGREIARQILAGADKIYVDGKVLRRVSAATVIR